MENNMTGFKISAGQKSLYLLQSHNPNFQYISHCAISIRGHLETAVLKSAIENVIQRHEILRTEFTCLPGMNLPVQVINDFVNLSIEESDLTNLDTATQAQQISEILKNPNPVKFDLAKSPLYQISIVHLSLVEHILIINLSSLCADTVSLKNIFQETSKYYSNYIYGIDTDAADEILQYADFCEYQYQAIAEQETELANIQAYWQKYDTNTVFNLRLPGEKLPTNQSDFQPRFINWQVDKILQQQIEDVAKKYNTNTSQILLTCWHILLSRLTGRRELVIGYNCDGRNYEELDSAIGLFNKTVPIQLISEKNHPFTEILNEVNQAIELCKTWQDAFDWEKVFSNSGYCPFGFEFTENNSTDYQNSELEFSLMQIHSYAEKFKLKLAGLLTTDGLKLVIHYDSNFLTETQIYVCQQHLENLLKTALTFPEKAIRELDIISDIENQRLREINDDQSKCFHQLFAERAAKTPEDIAIVYQNQQLTYSELNQRANQLAHYLQKLGVTSEVLVGLCLERSLETVIGILGILKAGGAYVALDPKYPQERIAFIVAETQLSILLTQQNLVSVLPQFDRELICIDRDWENIVQESPENPVSPVTLQDLAYVIYTSGSTGKPKGVQIPHGNISDYVHAMSQAFQLNSKDTYLHTASFSFSSSVRQLMVPLSQGATVVIAAIEQIQTPLVLFELIQQRQITIIDLVPSYWRSCTELLENLATEERNQILDNQLRLILSASEPLLSDIPRKWRFDFNQDVSFINMYGQTETTGIVCVYPIPDEYEDKVTIVPIGRPIANTEIYILDEHLSPVPVGEVGEIHMSGSSLARSYFNRPDLTDEKFIPNPFSDSDGALVPSGTLCERYRSEARLYKAGDLARRLPDGTIKFVGRADYQVKIRGQRVELGEIESIIALYPGVKQTIVMGRDVSGDQRLVAYIVPKLVSNQEISQTISIKQLRNYLKEKLPEYMVPSTFLILPAFPLTPTGKIDRRALPAPEDIQQELAETYVAPRNELELQLAKIWEQVLGVHSIGINDNFFELGGHSLLVTQVISKISQNSSIQLSYKQFFTTPTIADLAANIEELQKAGSDLSISQTIPKIDHTEPLPLSFTQMSMWFLEQLEPNTSRYHIYRAVYLHGSLNIEVLQLALDAIVVQQEALRTNFIEQNGNPLQVIHQPRSVELTIINLRDCPPSTRDTQIQRHLQAQAGRPFNLAEDLMLRGCLLQIAPEENILLLVLHHIAADGWSVGNLQQKLNRLYQDFLNGQQSSLIELPIQYGDFAVWQRQWLLSQEAEQQINYWQKQLSGANFFLNLPTDRPRPSVQNYAGATQSVVLSESLTASLQTLARQEGSTLFMILLAVFNILLYRYSQQEDILVGSPIAGRNRTELDRIIGAFINVMVLRTNLSGNPTFRELLKQVKGVALEAYAHQDLPAKLLVEKLQVERSLSYNPVFQVMFIWQNNTEELIELSGLSSTPINLHLDKSFYDLTLELKETPRGITGFFEYATDLFDAETISRMTGHFENLLTAVVGTPDQRIAKLPMLTPEEQSQLLLNWNNTTVQYPQYNCIHQLIEQQVERTPNAVAVVWENQELTYQELNTQANQIAHYLLSLGVQPEVKVGICVERSLEMIIGILAILKAGGAYLPLDPAYPPERLEFMLSDAQIPIILTKSELLETLPNHQAQVICLDTEKSLFTQQTSSNPSHQTQANHLAYIIYTSGSTGKPKGIMIEHRSLINAYLAWEDTYQLSSQTSSHLQMASFSFDVCSGDFVRALCSGAKLVICPRDFLLNPQQLYTLMQQQKIDCAEFVPAVLKNLIQYLEKTNQNLAFMKLLVAGSDSWYLSEYQHIRNFCSEQTRLINSYGVSEATIDTTYFETEILDLSGDKLTPIGRPFPNNQIYLLDDHKQPVPIGVPGELYIGGAGLARGYLHLPDLTADKFIPHPFADYFPHNPDQRLYRTNDKARYLADGNIEFLGRLDNQVKIRGFRIELGEIEFLVNQHPQIQESIVIVREDIPGDKRIVAYIIFQSEAQVTEREIRDYLSQKLPNHCLPAAYMSLDILPLTPNGKIDRKALPIPEYNLLSDNNFIAPSTATETTIATIWSQILGLERISIHDNFFALGGHSLLVMQVINAITQELSREISLRQFFQAATIAELAVIIDSSLENSPISKISIMTGQTNRNSAVLSFAQQRLWFLEQLEPGRADYHISSSYHCLGNLNIPALQQALDNIVARHEVLRTTFTNEDGNPIQVINAARPVELQIFDLQNQPLSAQETEIQRILSQEIQRPFNFSQDLMLRSCLLQISETECILLLVVHHIAADGWSMGILFQELSSLYIAFSQGLPSPIAALPIQYADFAQWQRQHLQGDILESSINYWKKHLAGAPELLSLPIDRPRPPIQSFKGKTQSFFLPKQITEGLRLLGKGEKSTLFMIVLAAFNTLLYRYTNSQDIVIGTALGNRQHTETQELIGFFVNTLALRTDISGNPSFRELLGRVREITVGSYEHEDLPFEKLIEALQPKRDLSYSPIFQVMLILNEDILQKKVEFNGLEISRWEVEKNAAQFDLTLNVNQRDTEILLQWQYNTDLFDDSTIERINGNFQTLLTNIIATPGKPISELPLLTANEQQQLLLDWNNTQVEYPQDKCIHQLFEEQVERTPNTIAVVFAQAQLTYQELNNRANQIAHYLQSLGIKPESLVGICLERSLEMVIGLLAILKAGAAYVPLDPTYPPDRVAYILDNCQAKCLLTTSNLLATLPQNETQFICLDRESAVISQQGESNPECEVNPDNLSYVIYTSGSTGKPKGVQICHQSLVNFISSMQNQPGLNHGDKLLAVTTISFDIHTLEIYLPLTVGATIILASREMTIDGKQLAKEMANHAVNVMQATPATWRMLLASDWLGNINLKVICGGEALPKELANRLLEKVGSLWNVYGPTETTVWSTICEIKADRYSSNEDAPESIGRPIANTQTYILDQCLQPVPIGVIGELYIGGDGVARGYLNRPELNAASFLNNPFQANSRIYKTGDLARYLSGGDIEYLGRIDNQVKIRGFRIEIGEIENVLDKHPQVEQGVVIVREDTPGNKQLVAYVVVKQSLSISELRLFLKTQLPDYMIPAAFVILEAFPLTPNGKVDRRELRIRSQEVGAQGLRPIRSQVAGSHILERELIKIWEEVLEVQPIGIRDNFFEVGGHSLLTAILQSKIAKTLGLEISITDIFQYPNIESLAKYLLNKESGVRSQESGGRSQEGRRGEGSVPNQESKDIAIIGMSGRFPGAENIAQFWQNLHDGVESIALLSDEDLKLRSPGIDPDVLNDPNFIKVAALIPKIEEFDAAFFGYSPREAQFIDPQQRIFLECAWSALENAGYQSDSGQIIGVYGGMAASNYLLNNILQNHDLVKDRWVNSALQLQVSLGNGNDHLTTRVAYKLNLTGPAINVQTACSTSLVAVHLACQSLLRGECDIALAGAVSLLQQTGYLYEEGMISSPDGHCRVFDAGAKGTLFGDGVGVVVLKPLQRAIANGDYIYATIKGSAINNDGNLKVGYTAPSIDGQATVIAAAQDDAGIEPETITYIEAHGTGTALGDPIEIAGLTQAFRIKTDKKGYCAIGSVKSNIGHLDTVSGLTGLIKAALALKYKQIPPSLNFETPNPGIDFANSPFYVNTQLAAWESQGFPRRAGVSSFGFGGTNAHVVLEEWNNALQRKSKVKSQPLRESQKSKVKSQRSKELLVISAKTATALDTATINLATHLQANPEITLADVAYTLGVGRVGFNHRRIVVVSDIGDAANTLNTGDKNRIFTNSGIIKPRSVVFMFSGQGSQYVNMARELYETEPYFQAQIDLCCEILQPHLGFNLRDVLYPSPEETATATEKLTQTATTQPALFVIEYAIAQLWIKWGITPTAMIGHSIGEYVAATLAGVFSLEDALALVAARGQMMQSMTPGSMLAVPLPETEVEPLLTGTSLQIAVINSPSNCVVSGATPAIAAFAKQLAAQEIEGRLLHTSHAFHSSMMEEILAPFTEKVKQIRLNPPAIPFVSNVTGTWITVEDATNPSYYAQHLRQAVRFADGVKQFFDTPDQILLEVGPGRTLSTLTKRHPDKPSEQISLTSIRHPQDEYSDVSFILNNLGQMWLAGLEINWSAFYGEGQNYRIPLPTYPFERQRYWIEPSKQTTEIKLDARKKPDISDWFYVPAWKQSFNIPTTAKIPSPILLFVDECGLSSKIVTELESQKIEVIKVVIGDKFQQLASHLYTINPSHSHDYQTLIQELNKNQKTPQAILHLWNVTAHNNQVDLTLELVDKQQDLGFYSLIYLVQALAEKNVIDEMKILVISNHLQNVNGEEILCPEKATLIGSVHVISQEYPHIHCTSVDIVLPSVDNRNAQKLIAQLLSEIPRKSPENIVAYRGNYRWIQTYEPVQLLPSLETPQFKNKGVYLITGGTGGIGLVLATHLAKTVQAKLILTGRTALPEREQWQQWLTEHDPENSISNKIRKVQELEALGAEVLVVKADVANLQQMEREIATAQNHFGQINGIIHAAGLPGGGIIQMKNKEVSDRILAPKVQGTFVLDKIFKNSQLDFVILCSSIISVLGKSGQVDYTAANYFLDAYANSQTAQDRLTISINWDAWQEVGMAVNTIDLRKSKASNINLELGILPQEGIDIFNRITQSGLSQVVVSTYELSARIKKSRLLIEESSDQNTSLTLSTGLNQGSQSPQKQLEQSVIKIWQQVLGIDNIGLDDNFFELGGDSLVAIQLLNKLRKNLDPKIVSSLELSLPGLFKTPTIAALLATIDKSDKQSPNFSQQLTIPRRTTKDANTLSFPQQSLWFLHQLKPDRSDYNLSISAHLTGDLNLAALQHALDTIVAHHEVLRTNFISNDGNPIQVINHPRPVELQLFNLENQSPSQSEINQLLKQELQRPFNLSQDLMVRGCLLQIAPQECILLLVMHHIASDGWSMNIFTEQLATVYAAYCQGQPSSLPELPIQYADFSQWQRQYLQNEILESSITYWKKSLADAPELLSLPTDRPRPALQTFRGTTQSFVLPVQIAEGLKLLSKKETSTLFMTILAAFNILLHRYTSSEDIVVGSPIANRNQAEVQGLIGFFVNTLALRTDVSGNPSFRELLGRVKEVALGAYQHQELPFEKLVEVLQPQRDLSYSPVFQVMLVFIEDTAQSKIELSGINTSSWEVEKNAAQFDLVLYLNHSHTKMVFSWEYNTDLFDDSTIERINGNFQTLLTNIIATPEKPISELPLLTAQEQQQLLLEWNNTQVEYPQNKCIHQLFEEQVERTPDAVAIVFAQAQLTYQELNNRANRLAHYLQSLGIKPESLVGICLERSLEMVIGLLAIQKAGGTYVPIDPSYPSERIAYMLEDAKVPILLTQNHLTAILPEYPGQIFCLDENNGILVGESIENPVSEVTDKNLIYIIYTSGSTGKPKGTMNTHQGVVNRILWMQDAYQLEASDKVLQKTPFSFDVSGWEFWWPLITGACLVVAKPEGHKDTKYLIELINSQQITTLHFVPSMLQIFLLDSQVQTCRSLRLVFCSGEALPVDVQERFFKHLNAELHNLYGPTEAAIDVTFWQCQPEGTLSSVPIGRPVANTQTYILDSGLQPVPIGVAGELYLGGVQLARGYLNRPELTSERFINNPFVADFQSPCLYKTGDLARYLPDGNIEYLGRIDNQVKIRGFRIELGEIENVLDKHPQIEQSLVIVSENIPGDKQLVAYVVAGESQPSIPELRQFLKAQLPDYMIPAAFVILAALPLSPNGKVDRRALPAPNHTRQASEETLILPRNQLEMQLTQIWQRVLGISVIGVKDNFFELGGHSLLAVRLLSEIQNQLGINLPLATFFTAQTVEKLANVLNQGEKSVSWSSLVPIQTAGTKPPLFVVHAIWGNILFYRDLLSYLPPDQPVYGIQAKGLDGKEVPVTSLTEMAANYIQEIRTVQPHGPYFIGGHSLGGIIVFEIALQLYNQGEKVALLAIFDTEAPSHQNSVSMAESPVYQKLIKTTSEHFYQLSKLAFKNKINYIWERLDWNLKVGKFNSVYKFYLRYIKRAVAELPLLDLARSNLIAYAKYVPSIYSGKLTLFFSTDRDRELEPDDDLGWNGLVTGGVELYECPGKHTTVMQEPNVKVMAEKLIICLRKAQENSSGNKL